MKRFSNSQGGRLAGEEKNIAVREIKKTDVLAAKAASLDRMDDLIAKTITASEAKPDCKPGCACCCKHYRVEVSTEEVFLILNFLRSGFTRQEQSEIKSRINANAAAVEKEHGEKQVRYMPCAFLIDGNCSIYAARPSKCRGHHSLDVKKCESHVAGDLEGDDRVPRLEALALINRAHPMGFLSAMYECSLDANVYEINTALSEAFDNTVALIRFKAGKKALLKAQRVTRPDSPKGNFFGE
ncbi:MAG: YkgJ family cysteine cluster protein [Gammaproteobacteria bacterium]|nr:YkgJ family cysteine cluster protein [Gammaproteobacteria bacterium]